MKLYNDAKVHDYLIDEVAAEEEELLPKSVDSIETFGDPDIARELDINDEVLRILDKIILYLRIVHSTDFYSSARYPLEDEMPNRLGLLHVRENHDQGVQLSRAEVDRLNTDRAYKLRHLSQTATSTVEEKEALKLGEWSELDCSGPISLIGVFRVEEYGGGN